jgi:phosphonate transport system permease protein
LPERRRESLERAYRSVVAAKRRRTMLVGVGLAAGIAAAAYAGEVNLAKFVEGLPRFTSYIRDILPTLRWPSLGADLMEWFWGWRKWLGLLLDTLLIAYLGTLFGALGAFAFSFLASANLVRTRWLRVSVRRFLEICRTVPEIVYALIFVFAFGLGPLPGVIAIAIHTMGALGKLFAEVIENIDMKPVEGAAACGTTWLETVRYAALPQVLPGFASYTLLRFEINVRGASVLGFVGAGGIGKELMSAIRQFYYSDVSAILLIVIATVIVIDMLTEALRHRLIGSMEKP